jgi:hypothetical protein
LKKINQNANERFVSCVICTGWGWVVSFSEC